MIISKTKFEASKEDIINVFEKNGITDIIEVESFGGGEFNAAFRVLTRDGREYVIKLAPPSEAKTVTYEKNMMRSEVFWYEKIRENTTINIPEVYFSDMTKAIIPTDYFVMEMIPGKPLWAVEMSETEKRRVSSVKLEMLSQIHKIHNDQFGYIQNKLYDTWYAAIRSMVVNLIEDCEKIGQKTVDGEKLLSLIDKHSELLKTIPCSMVNFDLWDSNVLYSKGKITWIDPERSYWGDPIGDFITQGKGQKTPLDEKLEEIAVYNKTAETKISANREECIRYAVAVAYLALIEEVEKYYRYTPDHENYIRNTKDARDMYDMAFGILEE